MKERIKSWLKPRTAGVRFFSSFEAAAEGSTSYLDPDIAEIVVEKTSRLKQALPESLDRQQTQNHFVFSRMAQYSKVAVTDWGGAAGATYFQLRPAFADHIESWRVVETEPMVLRATTLADDKLSFVTSLNDRLRAGANDNLWAQGILNFINDPLSQLREALNREFRSVYISRTAFTWAKEQRIYRCEQPLGNHGPGTLPGGKQKTTSYPLTTIPWADMKGLLSEAGFKIEFVFDEGTQPVDKEFDPVRGLLAFRR